MNWKYLLTKESSTRLSEIYAERLWSVRILTAGVLLANFFAFTLAEPEDVYVNTLKLNGVRSCSLFIFKEIVEPRTKNINVKSQ
jgi:hypothetical protein